MDKSGFDETCCEDLKRKLNPNTHNPVKPDPHRTANHARPFFFFLYIDAIGFPFDGEGTGLFARKIGSGFSAVGCWRPLSNQSAP